MWKSSIAFAQETAPTSAPQAPGITSMLPMMLIFFAIMWFFMIAPSQRREKRRREMLAALRKGDRVVTSGGICGTIVGLNDKTVVLKVSDEPAIKMEFMRGAVSQVASPQNDES